MIMEKTHIGNGTHKEFQADYAEVAMLPKRIKSIRLASQMWPIMNYGYNDTNDNGEYLFLWTIYYSIDDTADKQINKQSGKVEPIMTEKEGRQQDEAIQAEQVGEPELVM